MYNPYVKGRWYRFFIESDGIDLTITEKDLEVETSTSYMKLPEGFHVIDVKYDINTPAGGSAADLSYLVRHYADGTQAVLLPKKENFDHAYIYVFGYQS